MKAFHAIEPDHHDYSARYKLLTGSVVPRPIAFVTTLHENGLVNAAPYSQFIIVAVEPSLLGFSVGPSPREEKDTLRNIRRTGEFVINTVPEHLAKEVQACSEAFGPSESEVDAVGLQLVASTKVRTPRLAGTQIQFECRLHSITPFGASHLVVGRVIVMHAEEGLVCDSRIDAGAYRPLGRIGGRSYCRMGEVFSV